MKSFLNSFQRITSSNKFIPEIDGLRFVAIMAVVLDHLDGFIFLKTSNHYEGLKLKYSLTNVFQHGHLGVELFFVISGFILSYPFISHFLLDSKKPNLKAYFIRRVTRLEPPYIISMLILFVALIIIKKYSFATLFPSLLASLTYTHNFFYPDLLPLINGVAWSLEIEIQFYILAPLLANIFRLNQALRRKIILAICLIFIFIQSRFSFPFVSLLNYIQYFFIGFFLADLYISKHKFRMNNNLIISVLGIVSFLIIWFCDTKYINNITFGNLLYLKILLFCSIFLFNYFVLFTSFWKRIFSIKLITIIGGMCYSIYLIHYPIISMMGNPLLNRISFTNIYIINWIMYAVILLIPVGIICSVFYKFIEQPCMKKNWHIELYNRLLKGKK